MIGLTSRASEAYEVQDCQTAEGSTTYYPAAGAMRVNDTLYYVLLSTTCTPTSPMSELSLNLSKLYVAVSISPLTFGSYTCIVCIYEPNVKGRKYQQICS